MTQQNETEQQGAGSQQPASAPSAAATASPPPAPSTPPAATGGPVYPSPYLAGGEAVPQAYLAPPQPGQPRYGAPPRAPGSRPFGGGQQRYGQPPATRPAAGLTAAGRDPALAPAWHRFAAATIDWLIIIALSLIAFWSPLSQIGREMQAFATHYQDLNSPAAQAAYNSITRAPANERAVVYWLLGMFGIALVYYWVQHAAWGATVGKRALGVRVVRAADRSRIGVRQAGTRTAAFLLGPALLFVVSQAGVVFGGRAISTALVTAIYVLGGLLWVADGGLVLLDPQAQSLHDKLAGTVVVRQRSLDQRSRGAQPR